MTRDEFAEMVDNATLEMIRESRLKSFADLAAGMLEDSALTYKPSPELRDWLRA